MRKWSNEYMVHSRLKDLVEVEQELDVDTVIGYVYMQRSKKHSFSIE